MTSPELSKSSMLPARNFQRLRLCGSTHRILDAGGNHTIQSLLLTRGHSTRNMRVVPPWKKTSALLAASQHIATTIWTRLSEWPWPNLIGFDLSTIVRQGFHRSGLNHRP